MSMSKIISQYTSFEEIRDRLLYRAQEMGCDISESSFIYHAIVPIAWGLYEKHFELVSIRDSLFIQTSSGDRLTQLCRERGVERLSPAPMRLDVKLYGEEDKQLFNVNLGSILKNGIVTFKIVRMDGGIYTLESIGVEEVILTDNWTSLSMINLTRVEVIKIHQYARGLETDAQLRERFFRIVNTLPYAGNPGFYRELIKTLFPKMTKVKVKSCTEKEQEPANQPNVEVYVCGGDDYSFVIPTSDELANIEVALRTYIPLGQKPLYLPPKGMNAIRITLTVQVDSGSNRVRVEEDIKDTLIEYNKSLAKTWEDEEYMKIYNSKVQGYILSKLPYIINIPTLRLNGGDFIKLDIGDIPAINRQNIIVTVEEV